MDLLLDACIILDHIGRREPFYELSRRACLLGVVGEASTFITSNMVTDLYYLLRKDYGSSTAQQMIEEDLGFLEVISVTADDVAQALSLRWSDFEDCLVACCAEKAGIDYIVTRNLRDYRTSPVPAISPEQLFEMLAQQGFDYAEWEL